MSESYEFRGFTASAHMIDSIDAFVAEGRPVGHFLTAVLSNNLQDAVAHADDQNLANLPAFVGYLYNEVPGSCWGSPVKVAAWYERIVAERKES